MKNYENIDERNAVLSDEECMTSPFVFGAYPEQLRQYFATTGQKAEARRVRVTFDPANLANWFHKKIRAWSQSLPNGHASTHIPKIQSPICSSRRGYQPNCCTRCESEPIGDDDKLCKKTDEELRAKSNRIYQQLAASLDPTVARRFGHALAIDVDESLKQRI